MCNSKERDEDMILCDTCDRGYHKDCLKPPLKNIPEGEWICKDCKRAGKDEKTPSKSSAKKTSNPASSSAKRGKKRLEEQGDEDDDFQEGSLDKGRKRKSTGSVRTSSTQLFDE